MNENLTVTFLGAQEPRLVNEICRLVADAGCNVQDARIQVLGQEMVGLFALTGNWGELAKAESSLQQLERQFDLVVQLRRSSAAIRRQSGLPFSIQVVGQDRTRVLHKLTQFFMRQHIDIFAMEVQTYVPAHTETKLFILTMNVLVRLEIDIAELREGFLFLCDELNLDALIEPEKPFFI